MLTAGYLQHQPLNHHQLAHHHHHHHHPMSPALNASAHQQVAAQLAGDQLHALCLERGFRLESSLTRGAGLLLTSAGLHKGAPERPLSHLVHEHLLGPVHRFDRSLDYYANELWTRSGDQRTSQLPFMSAGPWKMIYATLIYLYLIKWLLPRVMERSRAFELNWLIRGYNLAMVLANMYAFWHGARILRFGLKCFGCEIIDHTDTSPQTMELLHYGWLFFMSRLVEWLDTIFFVIRKRQRQVTKLHVFHHSFVPLLSWFYLKYHPGYTMAFFPFVNTFVHTIMYSYYFLATFGPRMQRFLWWKKYLTSLQIAQFVMILIQLASIPLSANEQCQYQHSFLAGAFAGAILFLWLFYSYYVDTYRGAPQTAGTKRQCKLASAREGASRALSDTIEDAINETSPELESEQQSSTSDNKKNN